MKISNNHSPQFQAKTTINAQGLLNNKEVTALKELGQKIGLDTDTININLNKTNSTIRMAYNSCFKINENKLKINNTGILNDKDATPFDIIKDCIENIKKTYNDIKFS